MTLMFLTFFPSVTAQVSVTPRFVLVPVATEAPASVAQAKLESESMRDCAIVAATVWRTPPPICFATEAEFLSNPPIPTVSNVTATSSSTIVIPERVRGADGATSGVLQVMQAQPERAESDSFRDRVTEIDGARLENVTAASRS